MVTTRSRLRMMRVSRWAISAWPSGNEMASIAWTSAVDRRRRPTTPTIVFRHANLALTQFW